jgi:murein DD-endopeptidase MepM/ murein hydrolase activator NlpD
MIHNFLTKRRERTSYGAIAFFIGLLHALLWLVISIQPSTATPLKQLVNNGTKENNEKQPPVESLGNLEQITHRISPGDTLARILKPYGLSENEMELWFRSIRKHYSTRRLRTGREVYLYFSKNGSNLAGKKKTRHLKALELELNGNGVLTWQRNGQGVVFRKRERPYEIEVKALAGTITKSLYESAVRLGIHPTVISQFVDIFAWDVNFHTDVRPGDSFKILYNRRYRKGSKNETFHILAAALINQEQKHFAFYIQNENGKGNYYDLEGRSLARSFLRYPVEFSRISSTFSHVRFHPILKVRRPHRGVDFAAKRGAPVRAVADGKIAYAGWKSGGYGRFIEIDHGSNLRTYYAHLRGIARGIGRGTKVKKGQTIGYVGCTGHCTGAHLHFEFYKNGKYTNPLKMMLPVREKIEPALQNIFENAKRLFLTELGDSQPS